METESNIRKIEIWNFIRQNRNCFMDVDDDLKCSICKNVLINAQLSECNCSFCKECLVEHLKRSKRCLGNNCSVYEINIDKNVNEDFRKNAQIRKLKCKCPTLNCNSEMCIEDLIEHVKLCLVNRCPFVTLGCNFEETSQLNIENHINTASLNHNKLIVDLMNNLENKITILQSNYRNIEDEIEIMNQNHHGDIERIKDEYQSYIDVIKHEFRVKIKEELEIMKKIHHEEILKIKNENCEQEEKMKTRIKKEVDKVKKDSDDKSKKFENEIMIIKKESGDQSKKFENEIMIIKKESGDQSKKFENIIVQLKNESDDKSKKSENEIMIIKKESDEKLKKLENEIRVLKKESEDKSKKFENEMKVIKKDSEDKSKKLEKEIEKMNEDYKYFKYKLNQYENESKIKDKSMQEMKKTIELKCDIKSLENIKNEICQYPISFFVWHVDNIIQKREDAKLYKSKEVLKSDPFYTKNGYKLRLVMYLNGRGAGLNTHLSVYIQLLRSSHDEILKWPCTETLKYHIINTRTKTPYASDTFSFKEDGERFRQPTEEGNRGVGKSKFISWTDLLNDENNLIKDGSIYIKVDFDN